MSEPLVDRDELGRVLRSGFRSARRTGRRVWRSRAVTVVLVLLLLGAVRGLSIRQQIDNERWGAVRTVVVAKFSFAQGHKLEANDLAERPLPIAAIPDQALPDSALVTGRTLRTPVTAGQVLTQVAIGAPKARAILGAIGEGRVAVAIPSAGPRPPVQIGDHIDVHTMASSAELPLGAELGAVGDIGGGIGSAKNLVVVAVSDQAVTVASPADEVQRLVEVLRSGPVVISLRGR